MIGRELCHEAAESRPIIVSWLTKFGVMTSIAMLIAACVTFVATVRQVNRTEKLFAIKPSGETYEARIFSDVNAAAQEARRISTPVAAPAAGARVVQKTR